MSVVTAEKLMLDKQFLKRSFVILLLSLDPKCPSPVALGGVFFILHYVAAGYLSTLI